MDFETFKTLIAKLAKEQVGFEGEITEDLLRDDAGIDSMALLTLLIELGDHGYTLSDDSIQTAKTIKDLFDSLEKDN